MVMHQWRVSVVKLDSRGRLTLPVEVRSNVKATRFLVFWKVTP